MALVGTSPLPTMILASYFLGERLRLYRCSCGVLIIVGVVLVIQPSFLFSNQETKVFGNETQQMSNATSKHGTRHAFRESKYYLGVFAALPGSFFRACNTVIVRYLKSNKSTNSASQAALYAGIGGVFVALVDTTFIHDQKLLSKDIVLIDFYSWLGLWGAASIAVVAIFCGYKAVHLIGPVPQSFIKASGLITLYILQIAFFQEHWNVVKLVGAGCIVFTILAILLEDTAIANIPDGTCKNIV